MKILLVAPGADISVTDVWSGHRDALRELGHEVLDYHLDEAIMRSGAFLHFQYKDCTKRGLTLPEPATADVLFWAGSWLIQHALRVMPDWVLIISGMFLHPDIPTLLRRAGIRVAVLFTESPYDHPREMDYAARCDVAFTNERASVLGLKQVNPNVAYLPHAYDPKRHHPHPDGRDACTVCPPLEEDVISHDVCFIGTAFEERVELLEAIDWSGIDLGLYGQWDNLREDSPLQGFVCGGIVDNAMTAELYRRAKIGLNLYRQLEGWGGDGSRRIGGAQSLNPRAYELAACGTFQISDYRLEVRDLFHAGVPMFETAAELEQRIRMWLEPDRQGIRGMMVEEQRGYVQGHTFLDRASVMVGYLEQYQRAEAEQEASRLVRVS